MNIFGYIVLMAWLPIVVLLFAVLPPRRAVLAAFLVGWLFLPTANFRLPLLPDYTKMVATSVGALIGAMIFDARSFWSFRFCRFDVLMVVLCFSRFAASILNDLGTWDGLSSTMNHVITWAIPYVIGRIYFSDAVALKELAIGFFIGGLLYVPLCLFEIRMSPQLANIVYGTSMFTGMRLGGWRPSVFLGGLQLGLWMTSASIAGLWLWWTGALKKLWGVSVTWLVIPLFMTTVLCRSTGALLLLVMGLAVLGSCRLTTSRTALFCLLAIVPVYVGLRASNLWHGEQVIEFAKMIDVDRAQSFEFRVQNEDILLAKALQRPIFGWGDWGRARVFDEWGRDQSITDGLWIIELGGHGFVGLVSCFGVILLPLALFVSRFSGRQLTSVQFAPAVALTVIVTLYAIDCLPNAMLNPVYMLISGGLATFALMPRRAALQAARIPMLQPNPDDSAPRRWLYPRRI